MDPERQKRLNEVAATAVRVEQDTQVPAAAIVAQWAAESKWGSRPAGVANYHGIKRAKRHTKSCTVTTHEVINGRRIKQDLAFADYDSLEDSCRDYAFLISNALAYRAAWERYQKDRNVERLLEGIARVYATDPGYATLIKTIAGQSNVREAIANARTKSEGVRS